MKNTRTVARKALLRSTPAKPATTAAAKKAKAVTEAARDAHTSGVFIGDNAKRCQSDLVEMADLMWKLMHDGKSASAGWQWTLLMRRFAALEGKLHRIRSLANECKEQTGDALGLTYEVSK